MNKKFVASIIFLLFTFVLAACNPPPAENEDAANTTAVPPLPTATAVDPTAISTPMPTATQVPTETATATPMPLPSATATAMPSPTPEPTEAQPADTAVWQEHAATGFQIRLPARWDVVDIEEEGIDAIWSMLETFDTAWAQNITTIFSAEAMQEAIRFWAVDTKPAGIGYATLNVTLQPLAFTIEIDDLCTQMPAVYEQLGIELEEMDCDLQINGLDAARFAVSLPMGDLAVKQHQYTYLDEDQLWTLSFAVDETEWDTYEPLFIMAAESFRIDE